MLKNLLYFSILTAFVVLTWISTSVYHNFSSSTINTDTSIRITPIAPSFDKATIIKIREKKTIPADISEGKLQLTITPEPTKGATNQILNPLNQQNTSSQSGQNL